MLEFNDEMAGIARLALSCCDGIVPYYNNVPQDFSVPALFFPSPEIVMAGGSLSSYMIKYTWEPVFFEAKAEDAFKLAFGVAEEIRRRRNVIALFDEEGRDAGKAFRVKDPVVSMRGGMQAVLSLMWDSFRDFPAEGGDMAVNFSADISLKGKD